MQLTHLASTKAALAKRHNIATMHHVDAAAHQSLGLQFYTTVAIRLINCPAVPLIGFRSPENAFIILPAQSTL
jgi:hypothetical protein